jgi:hypothetical protein
MRIPTLTAPARLSLAVCLLGASTVYADSFTVTTNGPGVTTPAATINGETVAVENFNELTTGAQNGNVINSSIGTYGDVTVPLPGGVTYSNSGPFIMAADRYGGSGGTGDYIVAGNNTAEGNLGAYQLNLTQSENYFGLWWSAGDAKNVLYFYNGNTLVAQYTTADVVAYAAGCKSTNPSCYGNPSTGPLNNKDSGEPFLYLNIFDTTGTFNTIVFAEAPGSGAGFESDNHAVVNLTDTTPTGTPVDTFGTTPEPSTLGLFGSVGAVLLGLGMLRRRKQ